MKNIVATLIILHNIKSLFHACQLIPCNDENVVFASEKVQWTFARPCLLFCKKSDKVYSPC